jgi:hypothetical protein
MSRTFSLNQLTEGIRDRHVGQESSRIQEKWTRTGLLRGLQEHNRENMARLLENQAAQVLREANTLGSSGGDSGQFDGFSNIAFPIVRRVFGGLVANELVSIQPMSLPSGLLFYLDYTYGADVGGDGTGNGNTDATFASTYNRGDSIYNNPVGSAIRTGSDAVGGQYDLVGSGYSKIHKKAVLDATAAIPFVGAFGGAATASATSLAVATTSGSDGKLLQFDPQLTKEISEGTNTYQFLIVSASTLVDDGNSSNLLDPTQVKQISLYSNTTTTRGLTVPGSTIQGGSNILNVRRLNQLGTMAGALNAATFTPDPLVDATADNAGVLFVMQGDCTLRLDNITNTALTASFPIADRVAAANNSGQGSTLVIPSFESNFATDPSPVIPEIDIKIESIAVTATTRKLRARWSPELAQDLNAYHSMDAEVELTQILSEQIALEIDREILNDLLVEAKGANFYWSRAPGKFVNKQSGVAQNLASSLSTGPQFTGTVREWYETLVETIIDVANEIHRKTLRGSANFIVVSPEVATIFEASVLYKPSIKIDGQGQAAISGIGAEAIGSLSNRFTVYKDPYFPRNKILVGYKGGSYLESGYVYAPYVPLIVTPTIFAPEDFTPRKGVMTRYGKKMVRADFYGTVTCLDMDII